MKKEVLLKLVKEGIEDINNERSLPSKNKWAFYTAIVTLAAFSIEIFENSNFELAHIYLLILSFFFLLQLKNGLYTISLKNHKGRYLYIDSNIFLKDKKRELYVDLLISLFLYSSIFFIEFEVFYLMVMASVLVPYLVIRIVNIIDAFFNLGQDRIRHELESKWKLKLASIIASAIFIFLIYICVIKIFNDLSNFTFDTVRLAGIIILISILSKEVTKRDYLDFVLDSLTKIKNELNFDIGDIDSKYSQVRYLILGLSEPTHIQDLIKRIGSKSEKMHSKFPIIKEKLRSFENITDERKRDEKILEARDELNESRRIFNEIRSDTQFLFDKLEVYPNNDATSLVDGFDPYAEIEKELDEISEILDKIE